MAGSEQMFGNTVNTTSLLFNAVIINLIKATQSNVLLMFKAREGWQWRAKQQKICGFGLKKGCRSLWHANKKNITLHLNVIHIDDHAPSGVALFTKLYKFKFFHSTINEKE